MAHVRMLTIFVLLTFCHVCLWAQNDKSFILVRGIQGLELLPPGLSRQLEKVSLQVITKQKQFELLLSGTDTPAGSLVDMVAVEPQVLKSQTGYQIEARLIDIKTKKLLSKISRENIREEDLLRLFQGAMESLFTEYDKATESEAKEPKKPIVQPPRPKKLPDTTQTNSPDVETIDFAKRVRDLKSGVDKEIVKKVEDKKEDALQKKPKTDTKVNNEMLKANQMVTDDVLVKKINGKEYPKQYRFSLGWDSRDITTEALVATSVKAQMINLRGSGHVPTSIFNGKTAWSYDLGYSQPQSVPVKTPAIYQMGLYATWLERNWNISGGIFRDASFFVNLASPGEGLLPHSLTSTFFRVKSEFLLPLQYPLKVGISYSRPLKVESSFEPVASATEWQGSHVHIDLTPHFIVMGCDFNLMMESMNLTTQGDIPFTYKESRYGLSIRRSL